MNYKKRADDVRKQPPKQESRFCSCVPVAVAVALIFMIGCATSPPLADKTDVSNSRADRQIQEPAAMQNADMGSGTVGAPDENSSQTYSSTESEAGSERSFPTFVETGKEICTNKEGRPVIYLFTSATCPHCQWGGPIFDFIARYYSAKGLIEAHHYDLQSGDDLLTEAVETEIPAATLELYREGDPKDLVPYYNFACRYDRLGNGNEQQDDISAEGEELRRVIDALVEMASDR